MTLCKHKSTTGAGADHRSHSSCPTVQFIKMNALLLGLGLLFLCQACKPMEKKEESVQAIIAKYYEVYQKRQDFDRLLSFYHPEIVFEDIINGDRLNGKKELKNFLSWENPNFSLVDSVALVLTSQIVDNRRAVTSGYFTPFKWQDTLFEAMHFTSIHLFDEDGKIIRQTDWINYPSNLIDYNNRKNANDWISRNTQ